MSTKRKTNPNDTVIMELMLQVHRMKRVRIGLLKLVDETTRDIDTVEGIIRRKKQEAAP